MSTYTNYSSDSLYANHSGRKHQKKDDFVNAWNELSSNKDFNNSQYQFILDKKLNPLLRGVKKIKGFDVEKRHPVIKQVLYSLATQHGQGGALELIENAIGNNAEYLDDEDLINRIYDERSKNGYFTSSTSKTKNNIKKNRLTTRKKKGFESFKRIAI